MSGLQASKVQLVCPFHLREIHDRAADTSHSRDARPDVKPSGGSTIRGASSRRNTQEDSAHSDYPVCRGPLYRRCSSNGVVRRTQRQTIERGSSTSAAAAIEWHGDCSKPAASRRLRPVRFAHNMDAQDHGTDPALASDEPLAPATAALLVFVLLLVRAVGRARVAFCRRSSRTSSRPSSRCSSSFVVPAVLIVLFWMVHILPEKIAHKRNHPSSKRSARCACCRSCSAGCCGRLRGSGRTRSRSCTSWRTAPTSFTPDDEDEPGAGKAVRRPACATGWRGSRSGFRRPSSTVLRADLEALEAKFVDNEAR